MLQQIHITAKSSEFHKVQQALHFGSKLEFYVHQRCKTFISVNGRLFHILKNPSNKPLIDKGIKCFFFYPYDVVVPIYGSDKWTMTQRDRD